MIAKNAGHDGAIVIGRVLEESNASMGFNADEEKVEDLVESGVIDPTKVVRVALQNSSSIAGLLLTTEALVAELPEKVKPGAHAGHDHGGGYPDFD
jgi:chaperonin GroEL